VTQEAAGRRPTDAPGVLAVRSRGVAVAMAVAAIVMVTLVVAIVAAAIVGVGAAP